MIIFNVYIRLRLKKLHKKYVFVSLFHNQRDTILGDASDLVCSLKNELHSGDADVP